MTGPFFRLPKAVAVIAFCLIGCSFGPAIQAETSIAQLYTSVTPATDNSPANPDPALTTEFVEPTLPASTVPVPDDTRVVAAPEHTTELSPSARRFHYALSFDVRAAYDDNVTLSHNDPVDDLYGRIQAIVTLGLGDTEGGEGNHLGIVYTPSYYFYSDHSNFNAVRSLDNSMGPERSEPYNVKPLFGGTSSLMSGNPVTWRSTNIDPSSLKLTGLLVFEACASAFTKVAVT